MSPRQTKAFILKLAQYLLTQHGILPSEFFSQDLKLFLAVYYAEGEEESEETAAVQLDEIGL